MKTMTVPSNQQTLLRTSFVLGPFLLVLAALSFALDFGMLPEGNASYVEGIFGAYALLMFVPVYLALSARLSETSPTLGSITTVTGLAGAVTGFSHELFRVIEYALRSHGAGDAVWQSFYAQPNWEYLLVALLGPFFPLTSILLGVGFQRAKTFPAWVNASLIAAGIGFPLAMILEWEWGFKVTYPLACVLWFVSLSYIGIRYYGRPESKGQIEQTLPGQVKA